MHPRAWLVTTMLLLAGVAGIVIGLNVGLDIYGLFRPAMGRRLPVYGDERIAKYLLSTHYVPENFDGIVIGSSISANWDMRRVKAMRIYNASLNGGNIIEGKAILDVAIAQPGLSTLFLVVHPALTYSHDYKTVDLSPQLIRSALGSVSLWEAYKELIKVRMGGGPWIFDEAGTETFNRLPTKMNPRMQAAWRDGDAFDVDPTAFETYRDAIRAARARKLHIVFVVPPTAENVLERKRGAFDRYVQLVRQDSTADDKWIDFTTAAYADFRKDGSHFPDGSHLNTAAARQLVSYIDATASSWAVPRQTEQAH